MRLIRSRFTLRTLLVSIAVLALLLVGTNWAMRMKHRREVYLKRTARHVREVSIARAMLEVDKGVGDLFLDGVKGQEELYERYPSEDTARILRIAKRRWEPFRQEVERDTARVKYHQSLSTKYKRAASRPWEYVPPDPHPPG